MYALLKKGYSSDSVQPVTGVIDYVFDGTGYLSNAVQFDFGRINYLLNFGHVSEANLIDYEPFFEDYEWQELLMNWEMYRDNWEEEYRI